MISFLGLCSLDEAFCLTSERIIPFLFVRQEFYRIFVKRDVGKFEIDKLHVFHPSKTHGRHQCLKKRTSSRLPVLERTKQRGIENFKFGEAARHADELDVGVQVLEAV